MVKKHYTNSKVKLYSLVCTTVILRKKLGVKKENEKIRNEIWANHLHSHRLSDTLYNI